MRYLLLFIFIFHIQKTYAQDVKEKEKTLFKDIEEVVVTGQLTEKAKEDAVHKIRLITQKKINSGIFTDLGQLLEKELNIKLSQDNILGSSISLQGMSGQNVKILIDDIPVIGRFNGNIDLSQISLTNIEQIEIIEGPLSTLYGTDAIAGTINIITKKEPDFQKSFQTYYETVGKYNFEGILKNKNLSYCFERNYFNGWSEDQKFQINPTEQLADKNRFKQWKPKEQFINKIQYNLNKDKLKTNNYIEYFSEKITNRGLPREPYFENAFDEYYHTFRTNIGSNIKLTKNKKRINIQLAYNNFTRIKETFFKDLTTLNEILVQDSNAQDTSYFDLLIVKAIMSKQYNKNLEYQIGIEAQSESATGNRILKNKQEQTDYAIFSTIEYKINNTTIIRPSARAIYNTDYNAPFIPALNILVNLNRYKLRFSIAKGFRAPSLKELYLEFVDINHNIVGNENLSAEEAYNYQMNSSYAYKFSNTSIQADFSAFYNVISNKIDLTNSTTIEEQYSYFNIEEYKTQGISSNINITKKNTELNMGVAYIGRYNKLANSDNIPNFNFSTDYNLNGLIHIGTKNKINIFYKYVGKLPTFSLNEENIIESYTESYSLLDISINRRINKSFILSVGGKNLLDIKNIKRGFDSNTIHNSTENSIPISYGRTFFMSLNFKL
tara:strand:+ start:14995 stop:16992 length:1998 start_codon:yes stop_codon:yes gene_type:complete